jgi:hypothetical protein
MRHECKVNERIPDEDFGVHFRGATDFSIVHRFRWDIEHGLPTWRDGLFFNPKGLASFSPALARFRESLHRVANKEDHNAEGVAYQRLMKEMKVQIKLN